MAKFLHDAYVSGQFHETRRMKTHTLRPIRLRLRSVRRMVDILAVRDLEVIPRLGSFCEEVGVADAGAPWRRAARAVVTSLDSV